MLYPINRAEFTKASHVLPVACRNEIEQRSTICSIQRPQIDYKKQIAGLLNKVWKFIKTYFLFFFFDRKEENFQERLKQLDSFFRLYLESTKRGSNDQESSNIAKEFGNLGPTLQEEIRQAIYKIYEEEYPNKASEFYRESVDRVVSNPFETIKKDKNETRVFPKALLLVQNQYAGFGKKTTEKKKL